MCVCRRWGERMSTGKSIAVVFIGYWKMFFDFNLNDDSERGVIEYVFLDDFIRLSKCRNATCN